MNFKRFRGNYHCIEGIMPELCQLYRLPCLNYPDSYSIKIKLCYFTSYTTYACLFGFTAHILCRIKGTKQEDEFG